jgi:hypothetical protein
MALNGPIGRNDSAAAAEHPIQPTLARGVTSTERLSRATGQYERLNTATVVAAEDEPSRRELVMFLPRGCDCDSNVPCVVVMPMCALNKALHVR